MYNCEAVVSEHESERVRHMCMSSRECARETIRGKEERSRNYMRRDPIVEIATRKIVRRVTDDCWMVATGCAVFVPGM